MKMACFTKTSPSGPNSNKTLHVYPRISLEIFQMFPIYFPYNQPLKATIYFMEAEAEAITFTNSAWTDL